MILPDQVDLAKIAYYQHLLDEELEIQTRIVKARALDDGYYDEDLANQTMKFLIGGDADEIEGVNIMSIVLRTILRRLDVNGLKTVDKNLQLWANGVWDANQLDARQDDVHRGAERDGEYFIIVDYDHFMPRDWEEGEELGAPILYFHERYTSAEAAYGDEVGTNVGCKAHYRNDDPKQPLDMVSHRWIQTTWDDGEAITTQRLNLYIAKQNETPARIEKYIMDGDEFTKHMDEKLDENGTLVTEEWPIWWTDDHTESGESLIIPVIHFHNEEMRPVTFRLWGMQNGMDHAWSSLVSAITMTAHQIFVAFGFWPTTDGEPPNEEGTNVVTISARSIIGNGDVTASEASFEAIDAGDIRPIIDSMDKIAIYASFVAGLPINNFVVSKSVAGSATLRQGEAELVGHVNALQRLFGHSWARVFYIAQLVEQLYGSSSELASGKVETLWQPAETVNIEAVISEAVAQAKTKIPWQTIAVEKWGYTLEQVTEMEKVIAQMDANTAVSGEGDTDDDSDPNTSETDESQSDNE